MILDCYFYIVSKYESILKIDRKCSGSRRAFIHQRRAQVKINDGNLILWVSMMAVAGMAVCTLLSKKRENF